MSTDGAGSNELSRLNPKYPACDKEFLYDDCLWTSWTSLDIIARVDKQFLFRSDDVIIAGYGKCGNTLLGEMLWILHQSRAQSEESVQRAIGSASASTIYSRIPFLEMNYVIDFKPIAGEMLPIDFLEKHASSQRFIKTHLPIELLERAFQRQERSDPEFSRPVIVLTIRNPKDTAVSMYNFYRIAEEYSYKSSWDDFFEMWTDGWIVGGDYRIIYKQWAEYYTKNKPKKLITIVSFEDCVLNPEKVLVQLCDFFAFQKPQDADKEIIFAPIIRHTRFDTMKDNEMVNYTTMEGFNDSGNFMRKGQVGDWRNWYTDQQNQVHETHYDDTEYQLEQIFGFASSLYTKPTKP
ncbi:hypothetical protein Ciccas_004940 [Cichlidogyrus casuarinus]|uniref:Sulfotransferase domain-containing protein n=1 Tax=Cichlidogyrus casuarinus TaxID=1844966 RepID=A0ABD2QAJ1_9PLAT